MRYIVPIEGILLRNAFCFPLLKVKWFAAQLEQTCQYFGQVYTTGSKEPKYRDQSSMGVPPFSSPSCTQICHRRRNSNTKVHYIKILHVTWVKTDFLPNQPL